MASRKLPPEAQKIFDKYCHNFVMRLKKEDAIRMFTSDFKLTEKQAELMFEIYDIDKNGQLSQWEFKQFYTNLGDFAPELFDTFEKMRTDHKESLEFDKAWDVLKTVKNANGEVTKDSDLETLIKAAVGEEKKMDFGKFMNLFCRIKQSRS
ncbi:uncharacterized protein LOC111102081 [Crassostrea virginica]|uniref:Uncharacterized protein LOC111101038 n=1 Tax=Crassostrea virginica TaxID=6565 RepID=A0A8B8AIR5_CRAVI|nr:uncharacterized protein LOC111101038 [Crassostrea virginica]XP_022290443.1 uncharacterized protein LOC111102081 [Crassostrea virginica]